MSRRWHPESDEERLPRDAALLVQIVAALNDRARLPLLDAFDAWNVARPVPLETPWPPA